MTERTSLYRHYNGNGDLLYVGISLSAVSRLIRHRDTAHWFENISRMDVEWFDSREAAISAEIAAIKEEHPLYNVHHFSPPAMEGTFGAAVRAMDLEIVAGYLPSGLASEVQDLIDVYEARAKEIAADNSAKTDAA